MGTKVRGHICIRRKAKDGETGPAGKSIRTTVWETGKQYFSGDTQVDGVYPLDIVSDKAMAIGTSGVNFYMCIRSHTSSSSIPLTNTSYWSKLNSLKPVVTYLILAELIKAEFLDVQDLAANTAFINSLIASSIFTDRLSADSAFLANLVAKRFRSATSGKRVLVEGNMLTMYDANDVMKMMISGEDLSTIQTGTSASFVPGSIIHQAITESPNFNHGYEDSGAGNTGSITLASAGTLFLPAVSIPASFYCDDIVSGEVTGTLRCYWLIDGERYGMEGDNNNTINYISGGGTRDISVSIPSQKITLGAGAHTVTIGADIMFDGNDYASGGSGTFQFSVSCGNTLTISTEYPIQKTEVAGNGFRVMFSSNHFMEAIKSGSSDSTIAFTIRAGNYALRVTPTGLQKSSDGGASWSNL